MSVEGGGGSLDGQGVRGTQSRDVTEVTKLPKCNQLPHMFIDPYSIQKAMDNSLDTWKYWIKTEKLEGPLLLLKGVTLKDQQL